jgi:hypothetical protein
MTENFKYFPIHLLLLHQRPASLKNNRERIINGAPITKIQRKTTLIIFAIKSSASHRVYIRINTSLRRNAIVISVPVCVYPTFI